MTPDHYPLMYSMPTDKKPYALIGAGGFAREVYHQIKDNDPSALIYFFVDDEFIDSIHQKPLSELINGFSQIDYQVLICIADPNIRESIFKKLPPNTNYGTFVHKSVQILDKNTVTIGAGSIICAGTIITTNVKIGRHVHINLSNTIGHDTVIHQFVTTAPQVAISGNVDIDDNVYIGTNAAIREKVKIRSNNVVGMGAAVIKTINTALATFVGVPAKEKK